MYTKRVGCNINTAYALAKGFETSDRVLALEDDTVPGRDLIRFITWALDEYENDKSVFSVCGYQRTPARGVASHERGSPGELVHALGLGHMARSL